MWDIFQALGASKKGDKANIKIIRNKKPKTLQVTLDSDAPSPSKGWGDASNPFEGMREWNFGKHFRDDRDFPFGPMLENAPRELQDKIRKLEERLERLEGDNGKSKPTKPPKRLKGAQGTQKSS